MHRPISKPISIEMETGTSVVFIGANGSGKTRLGVKIEEQLSRHMDVHRIGAHRSLTMNTKVTPPSYEIAKNRLFFGHDEANTQQRWQRRWGRKPATVLLSDFDHVLAALYADENDVSVRYRRDRLDNPAAEPPRTKFDRLKEIWESVLPNRKLIILGSNVKVCSDHSSHDSYDASDLSDGERVIFYLIGQAILTKENSTIIIDEPELHINKAILVTLWDAIETERNDCAFVYLTHDLEFANFSTICEKVLHPFILERKWGCKVGH